MLLPQTTTPRELQRSYRDIFTKAKASGPVIVLTNNKPDVAIIGVDELERLYEANEQKELSLALEAIAEYKIVKKQGKLIKAASIEDILT